MLDLNHGDYIKHRRGEDTFQFIGYGIRKRHFALVMDLSGWSGSLDWDQWLQYERRVLQ